MFALADGIILHDLNLGKSVFSWEIEGWLGFHPLPIPRQPPQYKTQIWIVFLRENGCDIGALDPGGGGFCVVRITLCQVAFGTD